MRTCILLLFAVAASSALQSPAQENRDDLTPLEIAYTTTVLEDRRTLRIEVDIAHVARPTLRLAMPNWLPGTYFIGRFGEAVKDLAALGDGEKPLEVTRIDHQTWSIATAGTTRVRASYTVPPRARRFGPPEDASGPRTGISFQGPSTYVHVVGAKDRPVTARYVVPEGWKVANGLLRTDREDVRRARDYDTFADAPTIAGTFKETRFEVGGTPFTCVFFNQEQKYDFDLDGFTGLVRRIVTCQGRLFGSFPFPDYVFLFTLPGGGGLEHLNSTSIGLSPEGMKRDVRDGASVTSHEFFHAWNVKRIRPEVLGPFEYEHENYTSNLWVSEGWTSYFGDLTLVRTGIISRDEYLRLLEGFIRTEWNKDARHRHSVAWASRNVWHRTPDEPTRVDYYAKGEMLGAVIDLTIRHETGNRLSLDDVMRFLNRWFAERGAGFAEGDVERACTAVSNHDFGEFFARHVHGTLDPPLAEALAHAGIAYEERRLDADFPFAWRGAEGGIRVAGRRGETPPAGDGPRGGDLIISLAGEAPDDPTAFLARNPPGAEVELAFLRGGEKLTAKVKLQEKKLMIPRLGFVAAPTELQQRIRDSWLSGN